MHLASRSEKILRFKLLILLSRQGVGRWLGTAWATIRNTLGQKIEAWFLWGLNLVLIEKLFL